jgi:hypothetical protein
MVLRGNKEFKVFRANTEMLVHKDLKERRAKKAIPDLQDHKANKGLLDKLSKLTTKDYKVFKVNVVLKVMLETKATLEK